MDSQHMGPHRLKHRIAAILRQARDKVIGYALNHI